MNNTYPTFDETTEKHQVFNNAIKFEQLAQQAYDYTREGRHALSASVIENIAEKCQEGTLMDVNGQNVTEMQEEYQEFLKGDLYKFQMEMKQKQDFFMHNILENEANWIRVEDARLTAANVKVHRVDVNGRSRQAFAANVILMLAGFTLMGYQLTGYLSIS